MPGYKGGKDSLYDILEVNRSASAADIERSYKKLRAELEKDAAPPEKLTLVRQAHEVLSDPRQRAAYDASAEGATECSCAPSRRARVPRRGLKWGADRVRPECVRPFVRPVVSSFRPSADVRALIPAQIVAACRSPSAAWRVGRAR
jgi:curved DNA-binding protein CbpA